MSKKKTPKLKIHVEKLTEIIGKGFWKRKDVPPEEWGEIAPFLGEEKTFGVLISGMINQPVESHGRKDIIAGFDWIRIESNPRPSEPELNIYHFIVETPDDEGWCNIYGHYNEGAHLPHWADLEYIPSIILGEESEKANNTE